MDFSQARKFIYRNARPLDLARFSYHFENGPADAILTALECYQNQDGGFGHGLEPDSFNPDSSPIMGWVATCLIREAGLEDPTHPLIRGLLNWLNSGACFTTKTWQNCVPSNNGYPHAIWWEYNADDSLTYNPTASLAGFILKFADRNSELFAKGLKIAKTAVEYFLAQSSTSVHELRNFIELYEYINEANLKDIFPRQLYHETIQKRIHACLCYDYEKWKTEYVPKLSQLVNSKNSDFYESNEEIAAEECRFIEESQLPDGSYPVTWRWYTDYPAAEAVSLNFWKSDIIIKNLIFLKNMR